MPSTKSIRLVQFTDTHLQGDTDANLRGVKTLPSFRDTLTHAEHYLSAANAVLMTGDLVHDDARGYELIRELLADSPLPVLCVPGNHDLPAAMRQSLGAAPFQLGGHLMLGNWILIMLDSWLQGSAAGNLGAEQLQRLDDTLRANARLHALICLHHHPISMQSRWLDTVGLRDAAQFQAIVATHSNVRGVLWGHVHQSLDRLMNGVRYMATPATCSQFLPRSDRFAMDRKPPGYRVLELMPDGSIATEVVWVDAGGLERAANS